MTAPTGPIFPALMDCPPFVTTAQYTSDCGRADPLGNIRSMFIAHFKSVFSGMHRDIGQSVTDVNNDNGYQYEASWAVPTFQVRVREKRGRGRQP